MIITRKSLFTGKIRSKDLPVTQDELDRWERGELIQNVFPHLSIDEREFIKTGITNEEWNEYLPSED